MCGLKKIINENFYLTYKERVFLNEISFDLPMNYYCNVSYVIESISNILPILFKNDVMYY